jgi:hypothetical protein
VFRANRRGGLPHPSGRDDFRVSGSVTACALVSPGCMLRARGPSTAMGRRRRGRDPIRHRARSGRRSHPQLACRQDRVRTGRCLSQRVVLPERAVDDDRRHRPGRVGSSCWSSLVGHRMELARIELASGQVVQLRRLPAFGTACAASTRAPSFTARVSPSFRTVARPWCSLRRVREVDLTAKVSRHGCVPEGVRSCLVALSRAGAVGRDPLERCCRADRRNRSAPGKEGDPPSKPKAARLRSSMRRL